MSLEARMKRYTIIVSILIVLFMIGFWVSTYKSIFLGLTIGLLLSFLGLSTVFRKAQYVGAVATGIKKYKLFSYFISTFGVLIRIGLAILCVWLALSFPERLHLFAVITGFALIYVIIMTDILIESGRKR